MMTLLTKMDTDVILLLVVIVIGALSTFYSAKGNDLVNKFDQGIVLAVNIISFAFTIYAFKFMQAGTLYMLWFCHSHSTTRQKLFWEKH